ncbi:MAG TPA: CrcB family protein [Actinomycetota bacterium]|jgi:CrcB protein
MRNWLPLSIAGAAGVLARHIVQRLVPRTGAVPWGTFIVNVSGALLIGFIAAFVVHKLRTPMWVQEALTVGFLGGITTFSALALETVVLLDRGRYLVAGAYSAGIMVTGIAAVFIGTRLGRWL